MKITFSYIVIEYKTKFILFRSLHNNMLEFEEDIVRQELPVFKFLEQRQLGGLSLIVIS